MPIESQYRTTPLTKAQGRSWPAFSLLLVMAIAGAMLGCGSASSPNPQPSPTATPTPPPPTPTPTPSPATLFLTPGDWNISGASALSSAIGLHGAGDVTQNGNDVPGLGITIVDPSNCYGPPANLEALTGVMSGSTLTLINKTAGNTVTIVLTGNDKQLTGTYQISGSCLNGEHGTIVAVFVPPVTGTWKGTLTSTTGAVTQVTATVVQGPSDPSGFQSYPISGNVVFTGNPCITTGVIDTVVSFLRGEGLAMQDIRDTSIPVADARFVDMLGSLNAPVGDTLTGGYRAQGGSCALDTGTLSLTRQ